MEKFIYIKNLLFFNVKHIIFIFINKVLFYTPNYLFEIFVSLSV